MQPQSAPIDFIAHFFWTTVPIIVSIVTTQLLIYIDSRRRDRERDNRLAVLLENYRLHEHMEKSGPLHAVNIRYPRNGRER